MPPLRSETASPLTALVYPDTGYPAAAFEALVAHCRRHGLSLAGVLQHVSEATPDRRCDVILEDLSTGLRTAIFEDRGAGASSCRLDETALTGVAVRIAFALESAPDILVLNKFGKAECEGRGLRHLIAAALDRDIPVLIGVPKSNLAAWRDFAGDLGAEIDTEVGEVELWASRLRPSAVVSDGLVAE
jgi:hypothetical protein